MEQFAGEISLMLLAGTPFLVLAKLVHALAMWRLSFARRGSRLAKAELVAWLLLVAINSHTVAPWSSLATVATAVFVAAAVAVLVHASVVKPALYQEDEHRDAGVEGDHGGRDDR
jgi:hypothetical protein